MSTRYDDRDYERDPRYRRRERESSRYYGDDDEPSRRYRSARYENDDDWSDRERAGRREYSDRYPEYNSERYPSERDYRYDRPRYNYPTGFRTGERYGEGYRDYDRTDRTYGREQDSETGRYGWSGKRDWFDRASDEVASWFGDSGARQRRQLDEQRQKLRGRGPKGYRRSDERIKEEINDRLSDGYLDASDIEVEVANGDVTLTGTVFSRADKRRAEDLAEDISGVTNVENRLRVKPSVLGSPRDTLIGNEYSRNQTTNTTGTSTSVTGTESGRAKTVGS